MPPAESSSERVEALVAELLERSLADGPEALREICERFVFVQHGQLTHADSFDTLVVHQPVREYLGSLLR